MHDCYNYGSQCGEDGNDQLHEIEKHGSVGSVELTQHCSKRCFKHCTDLVITTIN
jgi:hypothetical protein